MPLNFSKVFSVILIPLREERRWKEQKIIFEFVDTFEKSILYIGLGEGKRKLTSQWFWQGKITVSHSLLVKILFLQWHSGCLGHQIGKCWSDAETHVRARNRNISLQWPVSSALWLLSFFRSFQKKWKCKD